MTFRFFLLLITIFVLIPLHSANAEEDKIQETVQEKVKTFTADFAKEDRDHFMAIYANYNLISVVEMVRKDVENAIEKCADENPDMEDALEQRYKDWDNAIDPIMEEAEANLENMIKVQNYTEEDDIDDLFEFLDKTREEKTKQIDKRPITSPEACEHLRTTMDKTQENLTRLLRSTLVTLPRDVETIREKEASEAQPENSEETSE